MTAGLLLDADGLVYRVASGWQGDTDTLAVHVLRYDLAGRRAWALVPDVGWVEYEEYATLPPPTLRVAGRRLLEPAWPTTVRAEVDAVVRQVLVDTGLGTPA